MKVISDNTQSEDLRVDCFKNPLEARGLHSLGAPLVHLMKFEVLQYKMLTSEAKV
jgi:hypothetical protein